MPWRGEMETCLASDARPSLISDARPSLISDQRAASFHNHY